MKDSTWKIDGKLEVTMLDPKDRLSCNVMWNCLFVHFSIHFHGICRHSSGLLITSGSCRNGRCFESQVSTILASMKYCPHIFLVFFLSNFDPVFDPSVSRSFQSMSPSLALCLQMLCWQPLYHASRISEFLCWFSDLVVVLRYKVGWCESADGK